MTSDRYCLYNYVWKFSFFGRLLIKILISLSKRFVMNGKWDAEHVCFGNKFPKKDRRGSGLEP